MSLNWNVFLKLILLAFLGFLIGIVSTIIYLAINVDLSHLDGLSIITGVLVAITGWYAYTTHRILDDQRKSKQISIIERRLEKLYLPLKDILENPVIYFKNAVPQKEELNWNKFNEIIPFQYLASKELKKPLDFFIEKVIDAKIELIFPFDLLEDGKLNKIVEKDIEKFETELGELIE